MITWIILSNISGSTAAMHCGDALKIPGCRLSAAIQKSWNVIFIWNYIERTIDWHRKMVSISKRAWISLCLASSRFRRLHPDLPQLENLKIKEETFCKCPNKGWVDFLQANQRLESLTIPEALEMTLSTFLDIIAGNIHRLWKYTFSNQKHFLLHM